MPEFFPSIQRLNLLSFAFDNEEKWAGHSPFFFPVRLKLWTMSLAELLRKTLPPMGYELVDWEMSAKGRLVRIFIDKPGGIDVEDCAKVSNQLTRAMVVEGIEYDRLEVSSPGLDRALTKPADYERFAGLEAQLTLREPLENTRKLKGILRGLEGDVARVETAAGVRAVPLDGIERARLVPKIDWRKT